jgi:ABC-2 type transport system permease protein
MFLLLVEARVRSMKNVVRHALDRQPLIAFAFVSLGIALFTVIFGAFHILLSLASNPAAERRLVFEVFYFLFFFLLAGAVPFVASSLLHAADHQLLGAAPIRPRTIVAAKLLDATVTNSLQFTVIGIPAIVACGATLGLGFLGWIALTANVLMFVLLPALITSLLLMLALALFGMQRVRGAIAAVNAILALVVCMTIVIQTSNLQLQHGIQGFGRFRDPNAHASVFYAPSAWFAQSLLSFSKGDPVQGGLSLLLPLALIAILYATCMIMGDRLLSADALSEEGSVGGSRARRRATKRSQSRSHISPPLAAVILKDFRYVLRDSVLVSQLAMPIILFLVPFALQTQEAFRNLAGQIDLYPFATAMIGIVVFMQTSILSLSSIGLEGRSFWILRCAPNAAWRMLVAKFGLSVMVSGGCGIVMSILGGLMFHAPPMVILVQSCVIVLCAAGLCGMGVGLSAALPRFIYENPAHRVSAWALILGFVTSVVYILAMSGISIVGYGMATSLAPEYSTAIISGSVVLMLVLTLAAILIPMTVGAQRLQDYQWEH